MAKANHDPASQFLTARGRRGKLLHPWLLILIVINLAGLILASLVSNTLSAAVNWIWYLWLLVLAGSVAFLIWRVWQPPRLSIGGDGIEYRHRHLQARYRWNDFDSITIAQRRTTFGERPALCVRPIGDLPPQAAFAQRMSSSRPPFRDYSTGWVVLCYPDQLAAPVGMIDDALTRFAGPGKRLNR